MEGRHIHGCLSTHFGIEETKKTAHELDVVPEGDPADGARPRLPPYAAAFVLLCRVNGFTLMGWPSVVTQEIEKQVPELKRVKVGMANLFVKHTSASLSINENCDSDVR